MEKAIARDPRHWERRPRGRACARAILLSFFTRSEYGRLTAAQMHLANILRRLRRPELVEAGDRRVPNFTHRFVRGEVEGHLAAAGFERVQFAERQYGLPSAGRWLKGSVESPSANTTTTQVWECSKAKAPHIA